MVWPTRNLKIDTERLVLRPPVHNDFRSWTALRHQGEAFLREWEPVRAADHLTRKSFTNRVYWANRSIKSGSAYPMHMIRRKDAALVGALTLDNIRRGPAQAGTLGYWMGEAHARQGYMSEAVSALLFYAFNTLDLSRIEAACLPENTPSRKLLAPAPSES